MLPTTQVSAYLRPSYEAQDGGRLLVSTLSKLGYRKDFSLYPCNVRDSYFYIADFTPDGSAVKGVLAYSVASTTLPLAYELGYEFQDVGYDLHGDVLATNLVKYQVVGLAVPSGQTGKSLKETLGNTGYLVYQLRQQKRCTTWFSNLVGPEYSVQNGNSTFLDCSGVKLNATPVNTMRVSDYFEAADGKEAPGVHLFNDSSSKFLARFGDAPQNANTYNSRVRVSLVRSGSTVHSYYTWAWLGIPFTNQLTITM